MRRIHTAVVVLAGGVAAFAAGAQQAPDLLLVNGRIATVDERFSIQEAVAIQGERIQAVGETAALNAMAGTDTRVVDLGGLTVIPGLIDNHNHIVRASEYWLNEARLDGVVRRDEALRLLREKAGDLPEGEWLMVLGGWSPAQFTDSRDDFTLDELDAAAPDRPAFVQALYSHAYVNSAWLEAMDLPLVATSEDASEGLAGAVARDARGRATGRLNGGFPMLEQAMARFPDVPEQRQDENIRRMLADLNAMGLTAVYDPGGVGVREESYRRIAAARDDGALTVRIVHTLPADVPELPAEAQTLIGRIEEQRPFQGDEWLDMIGVGEIYYAPFHWDHVTASITPREEHIAVARNILTAAARGGWSAQTHAIQPQTIDHLLDVVGEVNAEQPVRPLRWSIAHADNIGAAQIERARALGMNLQMRSTSVIGARAGVVAVFGEAALDMPPLRLVQDSGISFGLGTDGTRAAQINPFVTLWWAVTGRALNGDTVMRQTLSREEALIAHTRANAFLMFQEANLGAIRPGLLADMVVLDRDYLSVPAEEIRLIRPRATLVGGRIVHGEL